MTLHDALFVLAFVSRRLRDMTSRKYAPNFQSIRQWRPVLTYPWVSVMDALSMASVSRAFKVATWMDRDGLRLECVRSWRCKVFVLDVDFISYEFAHGFLDCLRPAVLLWQRQPCSWFTVHGPCTLFTILSSNQYLRELDLHCARGLRSSDIQAFLQQRRNLTLGLSYAVVDGRSVGRLKDLRKCIRTAAAAGHHTIVFDNGSCRPTGIGVTPVHVDNMMSCDDFHGTHAGRPVISHPGVRYQLWEINFCDVMRPLVD